MAQRSVLHLDMDAFFASVAQLDDPDLRGKPVLVGGTSRRGVVASASYEARAFGIRSAMPVYQALELCPRAIVVPGKMARYREIHAALRDIWARFAPLVEVASFDEAYMELTGCEALLGTAEEVAHTLRAAVRAETGLSCAVGGGTSKLVAKVASKRHKPGGVGVVPPGSEAAWLAPLAVSELPGIGPKTAAQLAAIGVRRVGDLLAAGEETLSRYMGSHGATLVAMARGIDPRPVEPGGDAKSVGSETTLFEDRRDREQLRALLSDLAHEVGFRLRRKGLKARTVTLKIRYAGFETLTRARTASEATDDDRTLFAVASALLDAHAEPGRPVRLLGVTASQLTAVDQLPLLPGPTEQRELNRTLDALRARHGLFIVSRGSHLEAP